jgi:hypothetical protein
MTHHAAAAGHGEHDHHKMHHQNAADGPATPAADDHGCMKCCAMCTVANALLPAANATVIFTVHRRFSAFKRALECLDGGARRGLRARLP